MPIRILILRNTDMSTDPPTGQLLRLSLTVSTSGVGGEKWNEYEERLSKFRKWAE